MSEVDEKVGEQMAPWEQHWKVINMPRFDYSPSCILNRAGFLITCTFKREKSATKEALALLRQYFEFQHSGRYGESDGVPAGTNVGEAESKISRLPNREMSSISGDGSSLDEKFNASILGIDMSKADDEDKSTHETTGEEENGMNSCLRGESLSKELEEQCPTELDCVTGNENNCSSKEGLLFTLVKLATMGVVYISVAEQFSESVAPIVTRLLKDIESRERAPPKWCYRILPIQSTCFLEKEDLNKVVVQLLRKYLEHNSVETSEQPLNYAVVFHRRGADVMKSSKSGQNCHLEGPAFGRDECIQVVALAVAEVITSVKVNLTTPELVVIVEVLPVASTKMKHFCAVSVLPGSLFISKPKLSMKPLLVEHKKRKRDD